LAGGYAKRMWPLTADLPKALLPLAGKPAIDHILDRILEIPIDNIIISTNLRFKTQFESWLKAKEALKIEIIAEESRCEEEKRGAVGAVAELASRLVPDEYLVVCGDNVFTSSLAGMVQVYQRRRKPVVAVYVQKSLELVKLGSEVTLDESGRIIQFEEKPTDPKSRLVGACIYILPYLSLQRTKEYLAEGGNKDEPGNFVAWLCKKEQVYSYMLDGYVWDIGTVQGYESLQEEFAKASNRQRNSP